MTARAAGILLLLFAVAGVAGVCSLAVTHGTLEPVLTVIAVVALLLAAGTVVADRRRARR